MAVENFDFDSRLSSGLLRKKDARLWAGVAVSDSRITASAEDRGQGFT